MSAQEASVTSTGAGNPPQSLDDVPIRPKATRSYEFGDEIGTVERKECPCCKRSFAVDRFARHFTLCERTYTNTREVFQSYKKRNIRLGNKIISVKLVKSDPSLRANRPNWRKCHEKFIQQIRETRRLFALLKAGKPLPPPAPAEIPEHYIRCPNCCRHFDPKAAERHFPFCEEKFKRLRGNLSSKNANTSKSMMQLREERRRSYRAPLSKSKRDEDDIEELEAALNSKARISGSCFDIMQKAEGTTIVRKQSDDSCTRSTRGSSERRSSRTRMEERSSSVNAKVPPPASNSPRLEKKRKICKKCTTKVEQLSATFCPSCGNKL